MAILFAILFAIIVWMLFLNMSAIEGYKTNTGPITASYSNDLDFSERLQIKLDAFKGFEMMPLVLSTS